jgi:flap endonuclease-1
MGISNLMILLKKQCPNAIKSSILQHYKAKKVACDASLVKEFNYLDNLPIHNFNTTNRSQWAQQTLRQRRKLQRVIITIISSHLLGIFNRNIMFIEKGIKPCWVFDGPAPLAKNYILSQRKERKQRATELFDQAVLDNRVEDQLKYNKRTVKLTQQMIDDAKTLIRLMGVPVVEVCLC